MTQTTYQWDPDEYAKHSAAQFGWAQELLAKLDLRGNETVLDIGCGDGRVSAVIAGQLPEGRVVGIDRSESMVLQARQRFPRTKDPHTEYGNLDFCCMDAAALGFAGRFDAAFSNAALHWVQDHPAVLEGVHRCLKPQGRVLFQMGGTGNASEAIAVLEQVIAKDDWQPFFRDLLSSPYWFYGPEEYRPWLRQAGLQVERIELIPKDMRHAWPEGLAGWIRTTWLPYTQRVPEQRQEAFIDEIVAAYLQAYPPDEQGEIHVKMVRLEVEARKEL